MSSPPRAAGYSISAEGLQGLPLQFEESSHPPSCVLTTWTVNEPEALAEAVAWLYLRKERHAARVTQALQPGRAALPGGVVENAITALSVRTDDLVTPWRHRTMRSAGPLKPSARRESSIAMACCFNTSPGLQPSCVYPTPRRRRRIPVKPTRGSAASYSKLTPPRPRCRGSCSARTRPRSIPDRW